MQTPIDPLLGGAQGRSISDGPGGSYYGLTPGLAQLARGYPPQQTQNPGFAPGFNPGGRMIPYPDPHTQLIQLISNALPEDHPLRQLAQQPQRDLRGPSPDPFAQHFQQVHAAQALAQMLAQQHTGGLRRYNGRT